MSTHRGRGKCGTLCKQAVVETMGTFVSCNKPTEEVQVPNQSTLPLKSRRRKRKGKCGGGGRIKGERLMEREEFQESRNYVFRVGRGLTGLFRRKRKKRLVGG